MANRPATEIGDGQAKAVRWTIRIAGNAHQAPLGLGDGIVARQFLQRPRMSVSGYRGVDESRKPRRQRRIVESEPLQRSWLKILDEHISARQERFEDAPACGVLEVEREALLVAVDAEEVHALAIDEGRTPRPRVVAAGWMLDLDDACAHVGQHERAVRPGHDASQVEYRDSGQNPGRHVAILV